MFLVCDGRRILLAVFLFLFPCFSPTLWFWNFSRRIVLINKCCVNVNKKPRLRLGLRIKCRTVCLCFHSLAVSLVFLINPFPIFFIIIFIHFFDYCSGIEVRIFTCTSPCDVRPMVVIAVGFVLFYRAEFAFFPRNKGNTGKEYCGPIYKASLEII